MRIRQATTILEPERWPRREFASSDSGTTTCCSKLKTCSKRSGVPSSNLPHPHPLSRGERGAASLRHPHPSPLSRGERGERHRLRAAPSSLSPLAATTRTSAGLRRDRCLPIQRTSTRRAFCSTTCNWLLAATSSTMSCDRSSPRGLTRVATSIRTLPTCGRRSRPAREG